MAFQANATGVGRYRSSARQEAKESAPSSEVGLPTTAAARILPAPGAGQLCLAHGLVGGGAGRNRQVERIAALVD